MGARTMKALVLGCTGMAGHMIALYLKEAGHDVTGFARSEPTVVPCILGDAEDIEAIGNAVVNGRYDCVINCIGVLNKAAELDKDRAVLLNSYLPHYLARITEGTPTRVIHLSTDCVFSGGRGNYTETDPRDGETFYARSKALGELEDSRSLTIRTSIVGPDMRAEGLGLLNWFMGQQGAVMGYTNVLWTGQTTLQLAKTIEAACDQGLAGLHNLVPPRPISKHGLLTLFNEYLRGGEVRIVPDGEAVSDKSLVRGEDAFAYQIPDYPVMLAELAAWMRAHRELYPHYKL